MDCQKTQSLLLSAARGTLPSQEQEAVTAHLASCADCRRSAESDQALSEALERLPRYSAPADLKARLQALYLPEAAVAAPVVSLPQRRAARRLLGSVLPAAAAACVLLIAIPAYYERVLIPRREQAASLVHEAVNDHLRLLISDHPLSVESSNLHQVKPWFTGRLDFTPRLSFVGDDDFPLEGGAVALFFDHRAASFVFKRRLHKITLFVLPAEGQAFSAAGEVSLGRLRAHPASSRGFSLLLWRDGEQAYILVSDLNPTELAALGRKIVGD